MCRSVRTWHCHPVRHVRPRPLPPGAHLVCQCCPSGLSWWMCHGWARCPELAFPSGHGVLVFPRVFIGHPLIFKYSLKYLKCSFYFIHFKHRHSEKQADEGLQWLAHSPKTCHSQDWTRPKSGTCSSIGSFDDALETLTWGSVFEGCHLSGLASSEKLLVWSLQG